MSSPLSFRSPMLLFVVVTIIVSSFCISSRDHHVHAFARTPRSSHAAQRQQQQQQHQQHFQGRHCMTNCNNNDYPNNNKSKNNVDSEVHTTSRRGFFNAAVLSAWTASTVVFSPATSWAEQEAEYRQGIKVDAFNGLIFNYRGGDFNGLDASSVDEPNISYSDFNDKLKAGQVEFVEFLAPDGDVAYATIKESDGSSSSSTKRLRIGEGYPIEQHDGYSSPMFAVRAVKNSGVPYKFIVPALMSKTTNKST